MLSVTKSNSVNFERVNPVIANIPNELPGTFLVKIQVLQFRKLPVEFAGVGAVCIIVLVEYFVGET